ncbi:MAG TPA: Trp biosynthesis-associated membrane protein, partial [Microlunatus sp.]|nr:Trp biosynthesis-associated membrane protein [Microlunatus sp.]
MTPRVPGRAATSLVLLLGAGVGFVASAQPWWQASGDGAAVTFTGSDVTGGLCQALASVSLAGLLLVLALRPLGRRIVAVVLVATGLGMVLTGAVVSAPDADLVRSRVRATGQVQVA